MTKLFDVFITILMQMKTCKFDSHQQQVCHISTHVFMGDMIHSKYFHDFYPIFGAINPVNFKLNVNNSERWMQTLSMRK